MNLADLKPGTFWKDKRRPTREVYITGELVHRWDGFLWYRSYHGRFDRLPPRSAMTARRFVTLFEPSKSKVLA